MAQYNVKHVTFTKGNDEYTVTGETYESKQAASGGTDVSLVTTGEKYTWNNKIDTATANANYKPKQTAATINPTASGNAVSFIDTLSQDANGVISATKKTVNTFEGATDNADGAAGLVPAPESEDVEKYLAGDGTWKAAPISKPYVFELDMVNVSTAGAYSHETTGLATTATMKAINVECSNPDIFMDKITVTVNAGSITLACADMAVGTSYVTVTVMEPGDAESGGTEIHSQEFDILANRITAKMDKAPGAAPGKFFQIDSNGTPVWGSAASWEDVKNATEAWLDENVSGGETIAVDASLSISGAAADAKVTGDLKSALAQSNIELPSWDAGYYSLGSSVKSVDINSRTANTAYISAAMPCTQGDVFIVTSTAIESRRNWALLSAASGENNIISRSGSPYVFENAIVCVPANCTYAVFNVKKSETYSVVKISFFKKFLSTISEIASDISSEEYLDNYITAGNYKIATKAIAESLHNLPSGVTLSGRIVVMDIQNTSVLLQVYIPNNGNIYCRTAVISDSTTWSDWKKVIYDSDMNSMIATAISGTLNYQYIISDLTQETGVDLNYITDNGWYGIKNADKQYVSNLPDSTYNNLDLFVFTKGYSSTAVTLQVIIDQKHNQWMRIINNSTHAAVTEWKIIDYNSRWGLKRIVCFGDSRTWYDGKTYGNKTKSEWEGKTCVGYQQQLRDLLKFSATNQGVSGETSPEICARVRAYDFTGFDAVLLEGGVNDFIKSSPPSAGEIQPIGGTFDTTTVYGAWQSAIEYIMTNYPGVKIYMTVPAIAWKNTNDLFPYATAEIKKNVAELYNLPILDIYKTAGITTVNRAYYYCDDVSETGWYLHFNDYGNAWIGQMIAEFIQTH